MLIPIHLLAEALAYPGEKFTPFPKTILLTLGPEGPAGPEAP